MPFLALHFSTLNMARDFSFNTRIDPAESYSWEWDLNVNSFHIYHVYTIRVYFTVCTQPRMVTWSEVIVSYSNHVNIWGVLISLCISDVTMFLIFLWFSVWPEFFPLNRRLKLHEILTKVRWYLTAFVWATKGTNLLMSMHLPAAEGSFMRMEML